MLKIVGLALLIYGVLGIVAAVAAYFALRGPAQRMRELFSLLAQQFEQCGASVKKVGDWIFKESPALQKISELAAQLDKFVREAGKRFGEGAQTLKNLEAGLDAIKVPGLSFQTKSLDLDFAVTVVKAISLKEYAVKIGPLEYTLFGPPLTVTTTNVGLDLGEVTVVTGVTVTDAYPFAPLGEALDFVGDKIDNAKQQLTFAADRFDEVKTRTLELKENLEKSVDGLKEFVEKLKGAGAFMHELGGVKLLAFLPALAAGFFLFIHLAFALTGWALLAM
jgi:hypothetical protein